MWSRTALCDAAAPVISAKRSVTGGAAIGTTTVGAGYETNIDYLGFVEMVFIPAAHMTTFIYGEYLLEWMKKSGGSWDGY